jgi:hypothetical protein
MSSKNEPPPYTPYEDQQRQNQSRMNNPQQTFAQPTPNSQQQQQEPSRLTTTALLGELSTRTVGAALQLGQKACELAAREVALSLSNKSTSSPQHFPSPQPHTQQPYSPTTKTIYPEPVIAQPIVLSANYERRESYWDPLQSSHAWGVLFFYLILNFFWSLFCFVWVTITMVLGIGLLALFPIGYSTLYFGTITWRTLAKTELAMMQMMNSRLEFLGVKVLIPTRQLSTFAAMSSYILNWDSWKCGFYFMFYKLISGTLLFVLALLTLVVFVPVLFCVSPLFLKLLVYLCRQEARLASVWLRF